MSETHYDSSTKMLGGLQMHEWMNNLVSDFRRISECIGDLPWAKKHSLIS